MRKDSPLLIMENTGPPKQPHINWDKSITHYIIRNGKTLTNSPPNRSVNENRHHGSNIVDAYLPDAIVSLFLTT